MQLEGELQPSIDAFKHLKGKQKPKALHWLADLRAPATPYGSWLAGAAAGAAGPALVECELREYDHLITKPKLEEADKITDPGVINERSSAGVTALADPDAFARATTYAKRPPATTISASRSSIARSASAAPPLLPTRRQSS